MKVEINNLKINYYEAGEGQDMLFLHGWGGKWQSWFPILQHFVSQYHVVAIDLPGFGESDTPKNPFSLNDFAEIVSQFINKKSLNQPVIFGHSFGGSVAVSLTANKPFFSGKLVLVDASGIRNKNIRSEFFSFISKAGKNVFKFPFLSKYANKVKDYFYREILKETDYLESGRLEKTYLKIIKEDITNLLPKITVPTLIIWGTKDNATPLWQGKIFKDKIVNSIFTTIPNTGHFSYLENPEMFCEEVEKFIK